MGLFDFLNPNLQKTPMNIAEITALSDKIQNCTDLTTLTHIYNQKGDYNNPHISFIFGISFFLLGDKSRAKEALIKGASFGLKYPCDFYDHSIIHAVGDCFAMLVTQFPLPYADKAYSATLLAYVYLSRSIEQRGIDAWDSYRSRAQLFKYNKNPNVGLTIIMNNLGMGVLIEPFIISDYYFASQALRSPHKNTLQSAKSIHQWLENISVGGKEADEYSLSEMADFGKKRHNVLFKILEEKYKKGELNMTLDDLQKLNG